MAFFKFRNSNPPQDAPRSSSEAVPPETVESLRRRALYRLIGAAVLVIAAIVGFPLLFDSQPRPVAIDVPIAIPNRDGTPPLTVPASEPPPSARAAAGPVLSASPEVPATTSLSAGEEMVTTPPEAGSGPATAPQQQPPIADNVSPPPHTAPPAAQTVPQGVPQADKNRADQDTRAQQQAAARDAARRDAEKRDAEKRDAEKRKTAAQAKLNAQRQRDADAARARALLDGQDAADTAPRAAHADSPSHTQSPAAGNAKGGRYVIQIGAFADAQSTQAARQKADRAGIKTYTQTITTSAGPRTRVRVGPFASRDEATRALARLKQAGLGGDILSP